MAGSTPTGAHPDASTFPECPTYPAIQGGTNWYSPSYSRRTQLMYVSAWEVRRSCRLRLPWFSGGQNFTGGVDQPFVPMAGEADQDDTGRARRFQGLVRRADQQLDGRGFRNSTILAIDPRYSDVSRALQDDGRHRQRHRDDRVRPASSRADARDLSRLPRRAQRTARRSAARRQVRQNPMTFAVNGEQYIAAIAGLSLFVFAFRDDRPWSIVHRRSRRSSHQGLAVASVGDHGFDEKATTRSCAFGAAASIRRTAGRPERSTADAFSAERSHSPRHESLLRAD